MLSETPWRPPEGGAGGRGGGLGGYLEAWEALGGLWRPGRLSEAPWRLSEGGAGGGLGGGLEYSWGGFSTPCSPTGGGGPLRAFRRARLKDGASVARSFRGDHF